MAPNPKKSLLDHQTALHRCINPDNDSLRTELPEGLEMGIELSHEDGDSVICKSKIKSLELNLPQDLDKLNDILSVEAESKIELYVKAGSLKEALRVDVLQSPLDNGDFFSLSTFKAVTADSITAVGVKDILAKRVKVALSRALQEGETVHIVVLVA